MKRYAVAFMDYFNNNLEMKIVVAESEFDAAKEELGFRGYIDPDITDIEKLKQFAFDCDALVSAVEIPDELDTSDITLEQTCGACPEQYDAFDSSGNMIGYLRMRHGRFTVTCPDVGGTLVYSDLPEGDGLFEDYEREGYLNAAKRAIKKFINSNAA